VKMQGINTKPTVNRNQVAIEVRRGGHDNKSDMTLPILRMFSGFESSHKEQTTVEFDRPRLRLFRS
jgi:hypothetical protein